MKQGDVGADLYFTVKDESGTIVNLTTASEATITLRLNDGTNVTKSMVFQDRANGLVSYKVEAGILSEPGELQAEVKIKFDDNNIFYADTVVETIHRRV